MRLTKRKGMTATPMGPFCVFANVADRAVMTQYVRSMPPVEMSHRGRRPMRSTYCAKVVEMNTDVSLAHYQ